MKSFVFTFFIFLFSSCLRGEEIPPFIYDKGLEKLPGKYLGILEDTTGKLTAIEVIREGKFTPASQDLPNLMISKSVFWVKFQITNRSDNPKVLFMYDYPITDKANLYAVLPDGSVSVQLSGEKVAINKRKYKQAEFIYDLNIPINETRTFLLEVANRQQIILPLYVGPTELIFDAVLKNTSIVGLYAGIIVVMFFYNLFLYGALKEKNYICYAAFVLLSGLTHVSHHGYTYKMLWPSLPWAAELSVALSPALVGMAGILFVRNFLNIKQNLPRFTPVYNITSVGYIACMLLYMTGSYQLSYKLTQSTALLFMLVIIISAARVAYQGYHPARYFFAAFVFLIVGIVLYILKDFGLLPYTKFTVYGLEAGSFFSIVMLSFALADKINLMRREKEISQARAMEALQENERIVREQNIMLEAKVAERTTELQKANRELQAAIEDLKEAQAQLVEAEKMASLGQLTAGIAHEINNPINFVVANIKPLKRDVDDMLEILNKYSQIKDVDQIREKLDEAERLRQELDLDYIVEEVKLLLKGMEEGANRTAEIVKGLRTFSRLDEGDLKMADINDGLESTLLLLSGSLGNIRVEKKLAALGPVECYAGKLNQVFMNILRNATQAFKEKQFKEGETPVITVETEDLGDEVIIRIGDNGIGIPENIKNRIFEPFFTTKEVGEGTGLGLSIAYNIIEKHHGVIEVDSQEGVGTQFSIIIPKLQTVAEETTPDKEYTMREQRRNRLLKKKSQLKTR
ncbi:MAG: hypothetical protein KatS3mg031_0136 [Chitinophagales bacterium]|nr:MAG: hypothetical protein KatS3mg031_0136 [Chitinophagales bacterium]